LRSFIRERRRNVSFVEKKEGLGIIRWERGRRKEGKNR